MRRGIGITTSEHGAVGLVEESPTSFGRCAG